MDDAKLPPGRPPGKDYGKARAIRFADEDAERIRKLAQKWRCSEAAAVRRAVAIAAEQEGVE